MVFASENMDELWNSFRQAAQTTAERDLTCLCGGKAENSDCKR